VSIGSSERPPSAWEGRSVAGPDRSADHSYSWARRWAAKEAAYKALYPGVKAQWKDLSLVRGAGGVKPVLVWEGDPAGARGLSLHCSLSHDADLVMAYVVAERTDKSVLGLKVVLATAEFSTKPC
jgi:phosphopantetheinyl transferase (holo-ACP synthase)